MRETLALTLTAAGEISAADVMAMGDGEIEMLQWAYRRALGALEREANSRERKGWSMEQWHSHEAHPEWEYGHTLVTRRAKIGIPVGDGWVPNGHMLGIAAGAPGIAIYNDGHLIGAGYSPNEFTDMWFWMRPFQGPAGERYATRLAVRSC